MLEQKSIAKDTSQKIQFMCVCTCVPAEWLDSITDKVTEDGGYLNCISLMSTYL